MKSVPFDYVRPKTLASACSYLSKDPNSLVLAGGQSLLPMLSMRLARPSILVDIAHIKELQESVWSYQSKLETHTVETHIHRLRKKIKKKFNDENFIISTKYGYQINQKK